MSVLRPQPPYERRIAAVREGIAQLGLDGLLVTHPPNLRYLSGFDGSMGAMLITRGDVRLIVDGRYITVTRERIAGCPALAEVSVDLAPRSLEETIAAGANAAGARSIGVEGAVMTLAGHARLKGVIAAEIVATERVVEQSRLIKDESEIATLREAARMLSDAATEALDGVAVGRRESDVAADIDTALRRVGFSKPAFETIVASGPNSALPHARPGARRLEAGDGVVLDFGGVYDGYCVDLTRTVQLEPASASFSRIFDAVREAHAAAVAAVRPGVMASAVDGAARQVLVGHGLGDAFLHGTGHGLGLEVHEEPRVTRQGTVRDELLAPGMVFTVEPGAYVAGFGGVRIEDDVLVTATGCEVLTAVPIGLSWRDRAARHQARQEPAGE